MLPTQAKAGLESRARECNAIKEHFGLPRHEVKVVTGACNAVSVVRSTNVEIDTELIAKIISAERSLTRWCLRMNKQANGTGTAEENLNMDPVERGHGQRNRQAHRKDEMCKVAHHGPPATLAVGRARGKEAGNRELRGGNGLQDSDEKGEAASTVVVSSP